MLTQDDIKKLLKVFATKQELKESLRNLVTKNEFTSSINKVLTKLDSVFKEVRDMRDEQTVHSAKHERIDEEISSIKKSLTKVESPQ